MQKTAFEITLWIGTNLDEPVVLAAQSQGELRQAIADWARSLAATRFSPESPGARRNERSTLRYIDEAAITARKVQRGDRAAPCPHDALFDVNIEPDQTPGWYEDVAT